MVGILIIELEKIGDRLCKKIGLDIALETLRESWRDRLSLVLKGDRSISHSTFANAIATISKENAIALIFFHRTERCEYFSDGRSPKYAKICRVSKR
jgi:hypothetical protein